VLELVACEHHHSRRQPVDIHGWLIGVYGILSKKFGILQRKVATCLHESWAAGKRDLLLLELII
jgi:hypothetical protein